jgi:hypothetical protein
MWTDSYSTVCLSCPLIHLIPTTVHPKYKNGLDRLLFSLCNINLDLGSARQNPTNPWFGRFIENGLDKHTTNPQAFAQPNQIGRNGICTVYESAKSWNSGTAA